MTALIYSCIILYIFSMTTLSNVKGLKFIHMNTRSLYRKIDEIELLYSNFDFICCSETWLDDRYSDSIVSINGMKIFRLDRPTAKRGHYRFNNGGGVCVYVGDKWTSYCTIYSPGTRSTPDFEILSLKIVKPNFKIFFVISVYKPPKGDPVKCIKFIADIIASNANAEVWILGDFNIDFLKRNVPSTKKIINAIRVLGLTQLIRTITRPSNNSGTCIDWIMTNSEYVSLSFVSNNLISDHYPVICVRKKERESKSKVPKLVRLYNRLDLKLLGVLLDTLDWSDFNNSEDPHFKWEFIRKSVTDIVEIMCPLKKMFVSKKQPPWLTKDIYRMIRDRERLSRLFRNTGDSDVLRRFKIVRNKVTQSIRDARSAYINLSLVRNKNNPRKFWRIITGICQSSDHVEYDGDFIDPLTGIMVPLDNVSMFLNGYFANIGSHLNTLNDVILDDIQDLYPEMAGKVLSFLEVDRFDILLIQRDIEIHKSTCIPGMRGDVCKFLLESIPDKFANLFNSSFKSGIYPNEWSHGYLHLMSKQGTLSNPSNWRPITQTNIFGKCLEKVVHRQMLTYFSHHGVISDRQYGFLPGRSTQEAIFDLVMHIFSSINDKKLMSLLFLDISKAFDCILHDRLLCKLRCIGADENVLSWFKSYLNRTQELTFRDITSSSIRVPTGIGQGTILGPLIFIFYMNDIVDKLFYVKLSMYADDCVLYLSGNNWNVMRPKLQEDLDCFEHWGELNNLHLNLTKTKLLFIASRSKLSRVNRGDALQLYNIDVNIVKQYNYLGVILDSEMTLRPFINYIKKTVSHKIFTLAKIRRHLTEHAAVMVYKLTILPYIEYAGFLIVSCTMEDRRDLQICQNDALRICARVKMTDHVRIEDLHTRCKIVSLEQRRRCQLLLLMYKRRNEVSLLKVFPRNTRRSARKVFKTANFEGTLYKRSPYYVGAKLWDLLAETDIDLPDIYTFKARLKRLHCVYTDLMSS